MQILIYIIISYLIYGAFLVWHDFHGTSFVNAPMCVHKSSIGNIIFALLMRPFSANNVHLFLSPPARMKLFGLIKLLITIGILGFIFYSITNFFS
jgi:hypothetical protein